MALNYTITFGGITIGNGTNIQIMAVNGLEDLPATRTDDALLGYAHGESPGNDYAAGRDIVVDFLVLDSGAGDYFTTVEALKAATVSGAAETLLTFQLPGRSQRSMYCRARRRMIPVTPDYQFKFGRGSLELHATDPRIYDATLSQQSAPVYVAGSAGWDATAGAGVDAGWDSTAGTTVDAGWDATAGVAGQGLITCTNAGSVTTYPIMYFTAPAGMSAWSVTNQTTGQVFTVAQTLNVGETLTANMQVAATGLAGLPVSIGGVSRYGSWAAPRTPFGLAPGANVLRFDVATGDPNASVLCTWQSAYI